MQKLFAHKQRKSAKLQSSQLKTLAIRPYHIKYTHWNKKSFSFWKQQLGSFNSLERRIVARAKHSNDSLAILFISPPRLLAIFLFQKLFRGLAHIIQVVSFEYSVKHYLWRVDTQRISVFIHKISVYIFTIGILFLFIQFYIFDTHESVQSFQPGFLWLFDVHFGYLHECRRIFCKHLLIEHKSAPMYR